MKDDSSSFTNFKKRDGKASKFEGPGIVPKFLVALLIKVPVLLFVIAPVALISSMVRMVTPKPSKKTKLAGASGEPDTALEPVTAASDATPLAEREFDLVLFGATGFTGELAARYLAKTYGSGIPWAIAGRKEASLRKIRDKLAAIDPTLSEMTLVIADTSDPASVDAMVNRTRVVATTVGPFAKFGTPLVRACVAYGTSYADITGEGSWVRGTIESYHLKAAETGAKIVHFTGHDCVPWSLLTQQMSKRIRANDPEERLASVEHYDDMDGAPSGGTISTMIYHMTEYKKPASKLSFDPLLMKADGSKAPFKVKNDIGVWGHSKKNESWYGYFVMAAVNKECIVRDNALGEYSPKLKYKEQLQLPSFLALATWFIDSIFTVPFLLNPTLRKVGFSLGVIPQPGEGPSVRQQEEGFLEVTGHGVGSNGTKVTGKIYFAKDAGYRDTARMLVESALCMTGDHDADLPIGGGGVFTPAAALGDVLLGRLMQTGTDFEIKLKRKK